MKQMAHFAQKRGGFSVGPGFPTRVNALIGASSISGIPLQQREIDALENATQKPDIVSDLSIIKSRDMPLWRQIIGRTNFVAGTLPIYTVRRSSARVDARELLEIAIEQMEGGVGLLTIHPTPTHELIQAASNRLIPITSRGGALVVRDLAARADSANVYMQILPELITCAKSTGTVISLGASFRSATLFDSCDLAQRLEIERQLELASEISAAGVGVIIEGPGHARPSDISIFASLLRPSGLPIMPLGPIPTDSAIGLDHVSSAIGATLLGLAGCAHVLAAVTREEHTGGVPSLQSTLEAVEAARVAARIIDLEIQNDDAQERLIATERSESRSCVVGKESRGCSRCASVCPL